MVRLIILFVLNFLAFTKLAAQDTLQLVLNEEFNDTELNRQLWNTRYSWGRTISSNHELEYYTDTGNIELQADKLLLIAKREPITAKIDSAMADDFVFEGNRMNLSSFGYTSGMLCSKQQFMYGKFEIRCRLPAGQGMWPAFWLYGGWPADEIDIMEFNGKWRYKTSCAIHSYDTVKYRKSQHAPHLTGKNFTRKFHVFTCYWYPEVVIWQVDGKEIFRFATNYPNQYKRPMPLIVNLAVGSGLAFAGPPKPTDKYPKQMEVDYIKVWQLKH